jgi:hypothetical protein
MYQLNKAIEAGKVRISMSPSHVGELVILFPLFDEIGREKGTVALTLTNGRIIDLLETFTYKQILASEGLKTAIRNGDVVLHL